MPNPNFPTGEYSSASFHGGHEVFWYYEQETTQIATADPQVLPAVPGSPVVCGIYRGPAIQQPENASPVLGAGMFQPAAFVPGRREPTFSGRLTIGTPTFLVDAAQRDISQADGAGWSKGLKRLHLLTGISNVHEGNSMQRGRYCMCQNLRLAYAENQPVQADVTLWPLAMDEPESSSVATPAIDAAAANELHWKHVDVNIDSTDYRNIVKSANLAITFNLERLGMRKDWGDDQPLSRTPYAIVCHDQQIRLDLQLNDQLPATFRYNAATATDVGVIELLAQAPYAAPTSTLRVTVATSQLQSHGRNQVEANALLSFTGQIDGSGLTIAAA